jgi:PAS domain-containing protein
VIVLESAAALRLVVTLTSVAVLLRARAELSEERARSAVLETVPLEWFRWRPGRANDDAHDNAPDYREFLARLPAVDVERLEKARQELQSRGAAFSTILVARSGAAYTVQGRRAASGDALLWLLDASAAITVQRVRQEVADLRQMLDAIPLPVWRRGPDRILVDCNRAYASALDTTADLAVAEGRELAPAPAPGNASTSSSPAALLRRRRLLRTHFWSLIGSPAISSDKSLSRAGSRAGSKTSTNFLPRGCGDS